MNERDYMIRTLLDYQTVVKDQERRISEIAQMLFFGEELPENEVIQFAIDNEDTYLKLKRLVYDIQGRQDGNRHEMIGSTDSFPSSLDELSPGLYRFHLPPFFSVQSSKRGYGNAGKHIFYLVLNLAQDYEATGGKIIKPENPLVVFEHHICTDRQKIFDFDNIDSKRALDAMQGFFIEDDNALSLMQLNIAVSDPEESWCDIYIGDRTDPKLYERMAAVHR